VPVITSPRADRCLIANLTISHCLESKLSLSCGISGVKFDLSECKVDMTYTGLPRSDYGIKGSSLLLMLAVSLVQIYWR